MYKRDFPGGRTAVLCAALIAGRIDEREPDGGRRRPHAYRGR